MLHVHDPLDPHVHHGLHHDRVDHCRVVAPHYHPYHCDDIEKAQRTLLMMSAVSLYHRIESSRELNLLSCLASGLKFSIGPASIPLFTMIEVWVILVMTILTCMARSIASHAVGICYGLRLDFVVIPVTIVRRSLLLSI